MGFKGHCPGSEELKIFPNIPQSSRKRFPRPRASPPPQLARYRNNLVALSQYYNLLLVASLDSILVYQPVNQDQHLINPSSIINLASSNNGFIGYMDPGNSHAIDQLVVADLGIEEIIVAVCDDGDVVAYTTRPIQREIDHRAPNPDDGPNDNFISQIRPFFISNVGMSAWGIAVHKEARMIAVSSNSKKINVFAFALTDDCSTPDASSDDDNMFSPEALDHLHEQQWVPSSNFITLDPHDRTNNLELVLSNHWTNIPNIAFFNQHKPHSSDQPIYLISTDIDNQTYIWDVWSRTVIMQLTTGNLRGWGVACIDPYFSRMTAAGINDSSSNDSSSSDDFRTIVDVNPPASSTSKPDPGTSFLPFHVLHTTQRDIRLFHTLAAAPPSKQDIPCVPSKREVLCSAPLHQQQQPYAWPHASLPLERLNMVLQVPELGMMAVGDQRGRVALMTMTRGEEEEG
ncbi:MAG: hypothetical protein Q9210_007308, partial [Variospora velana]